MKTFESEHFQEDDSFKRFFLISLGLHFFLAFGFTLKGLILPSQTLLIQNAIRVDMVALPDKAEPEVGPAPVKEAPKVQTEQKKATPTEKPKTVAKPDPKKAQQEALNKLKQKEAFERLMKNQQEAAAPTPASTTKPPVTKNLNAGNQLSKGDSVTGLERIAFDEYISQVKTVVNSNFSIPNWMLDSNLKATVEVVIESSGRVLRRDLVKPSGNSTFDNAALSAVDQSNPFPPAPDRLTRGWGSFTIQFNFPDNS